MNGRMLWMGVAALALFAWGCKEKPHAGHDHGAHDHAAHGEHAETVAKAPAAAKAQTTCPVMGGKINRSIYVDHAGKRVYLCCNACLKPFKADPEKYMKKLEAAGVALEMASD